MMDRRLPDGDKGPDHIRKIFYRMGFNDQEIGEHSPPYTSVIVALTCVVRTFSFSRSFGCSRSRSMYVAHPLSSGYVSNFHYWVGKGHTTRSGFDGPWTFSPTTLTVSTSPSS